MLIEKKQLFKSKMNLAGFILCLVLPPSTHYFLTHHNVTASSSGLYRITPLLCVTIVQPHRVFGVIHATIWISLNRPAVHYIHYNHNHNHQCLQIRTRPVTSSGSKPVLHHELVERANASAGACCLQDTFS